MKFEIWIDHLITAWSRSPLMMTLMAWSDNFSDYCSNVTGRNDIERSLRNPSTYSCPSQETTGNKCMHHNQWQTDWTRSNNRIQVQIFCLLFSLCSRFCAPSSSPRTWRNSLEFQISRHSPCCYCCWCYWKFVSIVLCCYRRWKWWPLGLVSWITPLSNRSECSHFSGARVSHYPLRSSNGTYWRRWASFLKQSTWILPPSSGRQFS